MALVARVHVDPATLTGSAWVHDTAHEFMNARMQAVSMLEEREQPAFPAL
jgi:hypothetical protein